MGGGGDHTDHGWRVVPCEPWRIPFARRRESDFRASKGTLEAEFHVSTLVLPMNKPLGSTPPT